MVKEDLEKYVDGTVADNVATAVFRTDTEVIFQDDEGQLFFLIVADPEAFEIGTAADVNELQPIQEAGEQLKTKISQAVRR